MVCRNFIAHIEWTETFDWVYDARMSIFIFILYTVQPPFRLCKKMLFG